MHGDKTERFTEEYQEELYKNTLEMLDRIDGFAGTSPWILVDFHSPRRQLAGVQDFFNRHLDDRYILAGIRCRNKLVDEQKAIASAVSSATKKLQLATKKLDLLESTKKALMQDLLTGKVRVKLTDKESAAV